MIEQAKKLHFTKRSLQLAVLMFIFLGSVYGGYSLGYKRGLSKGNDLGVCLDHIINQSPKRFDFLSGDCPNQVYKMRQVLEVDENECFDKFAQ